MALPFNITPQAILADVDLVLDLLTGGLNIDVVGIYDATSLQQLFAEARPVRASVRPNSKVMDQPVETGVVLSDHHVILPKEIEMIMELPALFWGSTYQQITAAYNNATLLTVQTKAGVFPNMIVQALPHEEEPDKFDMITIALRLREVQFRAPLTVGQPNAPIGYSPTNPVNQDTILRGQQSRLLVTIPSAILGYVNTIRAWGR